MKPPQKNLTRNYGVTLRGLILAGRNVVFFGLLVLTPLCFFMLRLMHRANAQIIVLVIPVLLVVILGCYRVSLLPWIVYVVGFISFAELRVVVAEGFFFPARYLYVINLEKILFLGSVPTLLLQRQLFTLGKYTLIDYAALYIHLSYFIVPHIVAIIIWFQKRHIFQLYIYSMVLVCLISTGFAFLVPTAPPWLASIKGYLPNIYRIIELVWTRTSTDMYEAGLRVAGVNDVAAMPSVHTAITVLVGLAANSSKHHIWKIVAWIYAGCMIFSLTYLGEHYVVDEIAGAALALSIWKVLQLLIREKTINNEIGFSGSHK